MMYKAQRFRANNRLASAGENAPVMKKGEAGKAVRLLQQALIDSGYALPQSVKKHGTPDGIFGKETKLAIKKFQTDKGLAAKDGIVGAQTMAKLDDLLFNKSWKPLPPLAGIGDADDPVGNARQLIMETLGSGHMSFMNFSFSHIPAVLTDDKTEEQIRNEWRTAVETWQYLAVVKRVQNSRIDIVVDTSLTKVAALYDAAANEFKISRPLENTFNDQALIVHEATHMVCDLLGKPLNGLFSEMVAFIAEARFARLVKKAPKITGKSDAAQVYELADQLNSLISKHTPHKEMKDLIDDFGAKIQADPAYSDFTYGMHQYNGIPS